MLEELVEVINNKFDYLRLRGALAELSGIPAMALTTYGHIDAIVKKIHSQADEIRQLNCVIEDIKNALPKGKE